MGQRLPDPDDFCPGCNYLHWRCKCPEDQEEEEEEEQEEEAEAPPKLS